MYRKKITSFAALLLIAVTAWAQGPNNTGRYYQDADGKSGRNLKTSMSAIINRNTKSLSYDGLYKAYYKTDVREDGKHIWDMYSDISNFRVGSDECHGSYKKEGDMYNREHSFPKSWFGGKVPPMYTDIFHLYPTDAWVNGQRGHLPFGEVDTRKSYKGSRNNFSKWGQSKTPGYSGTVFEPNDEYKGDFARTYFYMATRYEKKISGWDSPMLNHDSYNAYKPWAINMLLRWAKEDPVSQKEINRNNEAYKVQGNRNPFIDYPGLEQYVWGDKTGQAFSYDNYNSTPDVSGIEDVKVKDARDGKIYNMMGVEVDSNYKGIVIMNGRKYLAN